MDIEYLFYRIPELALGMAERVKQDEGCISWTEQDKELCTEFARGLRTILMYYQPYKNVPTGGPGREKVKTVMRYSLEAANPEERTDLLEADEIITEMWKWYAVLWLAGHHPTPDPLPRAQARIMGVCLGAGLGRWWGEQQKQLPNPGLQNELRPAKPALRVVK